MPGPKPEKFGRLRERNILFGDNEWGIIIDERPTHKYKQYDLKPFLFVPSAHLRKTYDDELKRPGIRWISTPLGEALWREYPIEWVNDRDTSRTNSIVRVYCTFDGRETEETKRVKWYNDQIDNLKNEVDSLLLRVAQLKAQNKELIAHRIEEAEALAELQRIQRSGGYKSEDDTESSKEEKGE